MGFSRDFLFVPYIWAALIFRGNFMCFPVVWHLSRHFPLIRAEHRVHVVAGKLRFATLGSSNNSLAKHCCAPATGSRALIKAACAGRTVGRAAFVSRSHRREREREKEKLLSDISCLLCPLPMPNLGQSPLGLHWVKWTCPSPWVRRWF